MHVPFAVLLPTAARVAGLPETASEEEIRAELERQKPESHERFMARHHPRIAAKFGVLAATPSSADETRRRMNAHTEAAEQGGDLQPGTKAVDWLTGARTSSPSDSGGESDQPDFSEPDPQRTTLDLIRRGTEGSLVGIGY